ncbi:hypothetical protein [Micromonospora sp. NPDC093277]|uniref:hypothetical protein n=1 Tax=Micromonospora sp. NPDC093277 TaxID=3364291 RepID=UPI0038217B3E
MLTGALTFAYSSIIYRNGSQGDLEIPQDSGSVQVIVPSATNSVSGTVTFIGSDDYYLNGGRAYPMAVQLELRIAAADSADLARVCLQLTGDATLTTMPPDPELATAPGRVTADGREVDSATVLSFFHVPDREERKQLILLEPPARSFTTFSQGSMIKGQAIDGWLDSRQPGSLDVRLFLRMAGTFATRDGVRTTLSPPSVPRAVADRNLFDEFVRTRGQSNATVHASQYQAQVTTQELTEQLQFDELSATDRRPPTVPPAYRLDVYPPGMKDPNLLSWPATGPGVVSIVDRRGEKRASQQLFLAGVGYGVALALAPLGAQLMPWLAILRAARRPAGTQVRPQWGQGPRRRRW